LPAASPVVLDDVGRAEPGERGVQVRRVVDHHGSRVGHAGCVHHVLGEALGALDPGRLGARAEAGDAGPADRVGHAQHQRYLGPDHHQVGPPVHGQRGDRGRVEQVDPALLGRAGRAGVARRAGQGRDLGIGGQGEDDGVLTGTGADHEDAHGSRS
jgi:hypothetical protein